MKTSDLFFSLQEVGLPMELKHISKVELIIDSVGYLRMQLATQEDKAEFVLKKPANFEETKPITDELKAINSKLQLYID